MDNGGMKDWEHAALDRQHASQDKQDLKRAKDEIQRLQRLIDEHNRGMDAECESEYNRKLRGCEGYTGRGKRCPECPKDHKIED